MPVFALRWLCNLGARRRPDGDDGIILGATPSGDRLGCPFWLEHAAAVVRHRRFTLLLLLAALVLITLTIPLTARCWSHLMMSDINMSDPPPENLQAKTDSQSTEVDKTHDRGLPFPKVVHGKIEIQHLNMYVNPAVFFIPHARLILAIVITVIVWASRHCKIGVAPTVYRAQEQRTS